LSKKSAPRRLRIYGAPGEGLSRWRIAAGGFAKVPETTFTVAPAKAAVQGERLDF
jgi:hypothetical protein